MRLKVRILLALVVLSVLFSGCSNKGEYYFYEMIDRGVWSTDKPLAFTLDSVNFNPGSRYALFVEVSANMTYPFQDIWLKLNHNLTEDKMYTEDTLRIVLTDTYGEKSGVGVGGLNKVKKLYLEDIRLDSASSYNVIINQIMSEDSLRGIEKLGIVILDSKNIN
ncbi:MAG: gliding motility lipoprotein GldH [Fermentimonas sp.]